MVLMKNNKKNLSDNLAIDRTILANERTYLAYIRTFISFLAAGIGIVKYLRGETFIKLLGVFLIILSFIVIFIGTKRYKNIKGHLKDY